MSREIRGIDAQSLLAQMAHVVPDTVYGETVDGADIFTPLRSNLLTGTEPTWRSIHGPLFSRIEYAVQDLAGACGISGDYALMLVIDQVLSTWGSGKFDWQESEDDDE